MLKDFIKQLPLTVLILIFLYVCGSLYLVGFWSTFDLDVSNIVNLTEIPKSFILPFLLSNIYGLIVYVIVLITSHSKKDELVGVDTQTGPSKTWIIIIDLVLDLLIFIIPAIMYMYYDKYKLSGNYWTGSLSIMSLLIASKFSGLSFFKNLIPNSSTRFYLLILFVSTICMSFAIGKLKSVNIYNNRYVKYIAVKTNNVNVEIQPISDTTNLKLLGFLGDKVIISSLDNKKIFVFNQDRFDIIELEEKESKPN
jgi:hypothetical protein